MVILIQSSAFPAGGMIPEKHTCDGIDRSPPLVWAGVPSRAISTALVMEDQDAAGFVHWMLFNLSPRIKILPEGIPKTPVLTSYPWLGHMGTHGNNDYGRPGYGGPCPLRGETHRYYFRLYALDRVLDLPPGVSKTGFKKAVEGHVIAEGELMGVYGR